MKYENNGSSDIETFNRNQNNIGKDLCFFSRLNEDGRNKTNLKGYKITYLCVFESNEKAIRFYEKLGGS